MIPPGGPDAGAAIPGAGGGAAARWTEALAAWAIPAPILAAAPEDPYATPSPLLAPATAEVRTTPTGQRVLERLRPGDMILDVGCGAGRISGAFAADHQVIGIEPRQALVDLARTRGIDARAGWWPEAAADVGAAGVVLCTHVLYDVADPVPFLRAAHAAASARVVVEVTAAHPWAWTSPLYRRLHDLDRPTGATADLLAEVIAEAIGSEPQREEWTRRRPSAPLAELVAQARRMLCLGADRDAEVAEALAGLAIHDPDGSVRLPDQALVTMWWDRAP